MPEPESAVPAAQTSWGSFLKQIMAASDLSSMTAPSFILSPVSLTEFSAYWGEPTEEWLDIAAGQSPEERMLKVLKWFICTLKGQYTSRETQTGSEKKPLNPILGELFLGEWQTSKGPTTLVSEQVSHHPPITAYVMRNEQAGLQLEGHNAQKTSFSGTSIVVRQVGFAKLTLRLPSGEPETYLITLPRLRIDGLVYGKPYVELTDTTSIQASSGFHAQIEWKGKGWLSGKPHSFKATVAPSFAAVASSPLYVITGEWHESSKYAKHTRGPLAKEGDPFLDVPTASRAWKPLTVAPVESQGPLESRRVWADVADGIRRGDFERATAAKTKLENEQRALRRDEKERGATWENAHFRYVPDDADYAALGRQFGVVPASSDAYAPK